jgi:hypothetical protein
MGSRNKGESVQNTLIPTLKEIIIQQSVVFSSFDWDLEILLRRIFYISALFG